MLFDVVSSRIQATELDFSTPRCPFDCFNQIRVVEIFFSFVAPTILLSLAVFSEARNCSRKLPRSAKTREAASNSEFYNKKIHDSIRIDTNSRDVIIILRRSIKKVNKNYWHLFWRLLCLFHCILL